MQRGGLEEGEAHIRAKELKRELPAIAKGRYGTVYKGTCRGETVAIKVLHNQELEKEKMAELVAEVDIMRRLKHPCILLLMGVCTESGNVSLVMEYVDGKSLEKILHNHKLVLGDHQKLRLARDIAKGLNWLHCLDPPILHRDLKPPNILVGKNFEVKVCDFGLAAVKEIKETEELAETAVGSPIWMAPEVLSGHPNTEKSDVYAYGIILWEIITRKPPFADVKSFEQFLHEIIDLDKRPEFPSSVDPALQALVESCWHPNPKKRPSMQKILDKLDEIIVDTLIKDQQARELWKDLKKSKGSSEVWEHYPFYLTLDSLMTGLCAKVNPTAVIDPLEARYRCLALQLTDKLNDLTREERYLEIVRCEKFGSFVELFGPLVNEAEDIMDKFENLCRPGWFHGSIDTGEAELRLLNKKPGWFLIRLSSKANCITVSVVSRNNRISHQRVQKRDGTYNVRVDGQVKRFPNIAALVLSMKKPWHLKHVCAESCKFMKIFHDMKSSGYADADMLDEQLSEAAGVVKEKKKKKDKKDRKRTIGKTRKKNKRKSSKKDLQT